MVSLYVEVTTENVTGELLTRPRYRQGFLFNLRNALPFPS